MQQQMTIYDWLDPDTASGKTCQEPCLPANQKERISKPSSRSSSASQSRTLPMFLFLRKDGTSQESSWETLGPLPTNSMMPSTGVFLRDGNASVSLSTIADILPQEFCLALNFGEMPKMSNPTKLSDILEENADEKYRLSSRACAGIINRANKRGKELPEILRQALENQIDNEDCEELHTED